MDRQRQKYTNGPPEAATRGPPAFYFTRLYPAQRMQSLLTSNWQGSMTRLQNSLFLHCIGAKTTKTVLLTKIVIFTH